MLARARAGVFCEGATTQPAKDRSRCADRGPADVSLPLRNTPAQAPKLKQTASFDSIEEKNIRGSQIDLWDSPFCISEKHMFFTFMENQKYKVQINVRLGNLTRRAFPVFPAITMKEFRQKCRTLETRGISKI